MRPPAPKFPAERETPIVTLFDFRKPERFQLAVEIRNAERRYAIRLNSDVFARYRDARRLDRWLSADTEYGWRGMQFP